MKRSLEGLRVLDVTDEKGYFCGKILGDLGADVIKVEPPEGDAGRKIGPFYKDDPNKEKSLFWMAQNTSKRSITLNIETAEGQSIFRDLLKTSDFVIHTFSSGYLQRLNLGYEAIKRIHPGLISVSITPFGQDGPYEGYKACDLVSMAMGGLMFITGYPDRPPVRLGVPQACLLGGAHAASGALIANYFRRKTGLGQEVDTSIHEAVTRTLFMEPLFWDIQKSIIHRDGHFIRRGNLRQREVWECKDGLTFFRIFGGPYGRRNKGLVEWMRKEDGSAGELDKIVWDGLDLGKLSQEQCEKLEADIDRFLRNRLKKEIESVALAGKITSLFPCYSCSDISKDDHLSERGYWVDLNYPHIEESIRHPGAFCKMTRTPIEVKPAPRIGEHNKEIYMGELGLGENEYQMLTVAGVV